MIHKKEEALKILNMNAWTFENLVKNHGLEGKRMPGKGRFLYYSLDKIQQAEQRKDADIIARRGGGVDGAGSHGNVRSYQFRRRAVGKI